MSDVQTSEVHWYSGSCRRVCIVEGEGVLTNELSVYVFRAGDDADAARRLLELASAQDKEYLNADGERVRWALVSIETIDELGDGQMQDVEVYSKMTQIEPPDTSLTLDTRFTPENDEPGLSGVMGW
jgi:hypothetical protein